MGPKIPSRLADLVYHCVIAFHSSGDASSCGLAHCIAVLSNLGFVSLLGCFGIVFVNSEFLDAKIPPNTSHIYRPLRRPADGKSDRIALISNSLGTVED